MSVETLGEWKAAFLDHREQFVLQGAQNALPRDVTIGDYRFRQVADRLVSRGLLKVTNSASNAASYALTDAGRGKLLALHGPTLPSSLPADQAPTAIAAE